VVTATCGARQHIDLLGNATILAAALLLSISICPPAGAQSLAQGEPAKPATTAPKAAKPRTPPSPKSAGPKRAKAPPQQAKLLDPAKIDPMQIDPMEIDPKKLDARTPNAWIALGLLELRGGNLAGAQESLERTMALGDQRRNKAAIAAAALVLGRLYAVRFGFTQSEARNVALVGGRPDELTKSSRREFEKAKTLFEKALALHKALGRKDAMAAGYSRLGDLYKIAKDFDQAQAMIGESLTLNKALQRKKEMAANYRALAGTHRYDLDQAEALLKEAAALHEALGLKEEMATDYEELAANNRTRGELFEAERLYKQALALASRDNQIQILRALEQVYRDRNDPGQAGEMHEQASALDKEREKDNGGRGLLFSWSLGLWVSTAVTKRQIEALEKAVPMEMAIGHRAGLATSYTLLGLHYGQRAEIDEGKRAEFEGKAERMFKDAVALNKSLGRERALTHAYRQLAEILDQRGNPGQAEATLKEALALHQKLGNEDDMAQLYWSLGSKAHKRGDEAQACAYWRQGAAAYPNNVVTYPNKKRLVEALNENKCGTTQ
jgi:tetratricopeptide (TPR) repeat protein